MGAFNFPGVIWAIDGCHIPFKAPSQNANLYYNRKKNSTVLRAVCKHDLVLITAINVG